MNKSKRHHFVPQFITKYFSKEDGLIHIYDKVADKFYDGNAVNLFVENDRNTFPNLEGIDDDVIERVYTSFDTLFSNVLHQITTTAKVSGVHFKLLLVFAYISKWRVRQYDESFKTAKEYFSVGDLGLGVIDSNDDRLDINLEDYFGLDMQQELKRILLAIQPFRFKEDFEMLLGSSFIIETPINSFIGDCPFNEATILGCEIFEDFVFPVTKDLTLVYSTRIDRNELQDFLLNGNEEKVGLFLRDFSTSRDVSTLDLAERNVGCCDLDYLKLIVKTYKDFKARGTDTAYHLTAFNLLYRFREYA